MHVWSDERRDIKSYRIHVRDSCKSVCVSVSQEPFLTGVKVFTGEKARMNMKIILALYCLGEARVRANCVI